MLLKKENVRYFWWIFAAAAAFITIFMHTYKICEIPFGLNVDEASGAYDALNIARYGVDRYLNSYPVYFTNYGDGQNALYIYMTAVLIKIFGISKLVIRVSIILAAFAGAYFIYRYCTYSWKGRQINAVALMLYAILPVFTMTQRFGLESHLMLAAGLASIYFLARALETGSVWYYLGAGVVCGVTLYTYAIAYIVLPICIFFLFLYGLRLKCFNLKRVIAFVVPLGILAAPLILVQIVNMFDLPAFRVGPFTITKLITYRSNEVGISDIWGNMKSVLFNTLLYDNRTYNSTALFGNMYYISIPFIVLGIGKSIVDMVYSVRDKVFSYSVPMVTWLFGQLVIGVLLTGGTVPNNTRMIGIFGCLLYFLTVGLVFVWDLCKKTWLKYSFAGVLGTLYCIGFLCFAKYYFVDFNTEAYPFNWLFFESYDDLGDFAEEHKGDAFLERATAYPLNYIYYLLEFEVSPYDFNLPVNGKERFGQHDINEYLDHTDYRYNYVVYEKDTSSQELLEQMGYKKILDKEFLYYITPLEDFEEKPHAEGSFALDNVQIEDEHMRISGWAVNPSKVQVYDAVRLKTETKVYEAEQTERSGVAQHLGNDAYVNCGYEFDLPMALFTDAENVQLYGVDEMGEETLLYSWERK